MGKKQFFLFILLLLLFRSYGQYQIDSVRQLPGTFEFNLKKIDSLNIRKVKQILYLSEKEKQNKGLNRDIYSEITEYQYKKNKIIKESHTYSGTDIRGKDHFTAKKIGFNTYSMIFENDFIYDKDGFLIRIDQNVPFKYCDSGLENLNELQPHQFTIDQLPIDQYLLIYFDIEVEYILWQITKNRYLYFKIIQ